MGLRSTIVLSQSLEIAVTDERSYEHILYEVDRNRARVTLNRPKQRNALSLALIEELEAALWEADDDQSVQ